MYEITSRFKPPKVRKEKAQPDNVAKAMVAYGVAFKAVYGTSPLLSYDKVSKRISVGSDRVDLKRLKELTTMLKMRAGT